jgi:hypothetical protein
LRCLNILEEDIMVRSKRWAGAAGVALGLLIVTVPVYAENAVLKSTAIGNPQLKSIETIGFGPGGVLLIGDSKGAQVVAVATGDTTPKPWSKVEIAKIDEKLAARIGTTAKGIEILKLAVNPASFTAYFAVRNREGKKDLILTLDAAGKIDEFLLDNVKYARIPLPAGDKAPISKITDIACGDDRVLVAAQANEQFASKIVSIPLPLENGSKAAVFSTETYHVAHKRWETNAPIRTVIPYMQDGQKYLVGAFTCTPLVKYPLNDLQPGARVKGVSVFEPGNGNTPRGMFAYEKGGKHYILMNVVRMGKFQQSRPIGPSPYWTVRIDQGLLGEKEKINEKAQWRADKNLKPITDRAAVAEAFHGVTLMARLDAERALVLRDDKGGLNLQTLALP